MTIENAGSLRRSWVRVRELLTLIRVRSFDTSTKAGRSQERYRRALLTATAAAFARVVSILTVLVTVPLTLNYLGPERYGLWMTISSLMVFLGFADLGLGNGLMNAVSSAFGRDDRAAARTSVSSGFFMLLGVAVVVLGLFAAICPVSPWEGVFKVSQLWQALGNIIGLVAVLEASQIRGLERETRFYQASTSEASTSELFGAVKETDRLLSSCLRVELLPVKPIGPNSGA